MTNKSKIYFRKVKSNGIKLYQIIFFGLVFQLSTNTSRSNGDIETSKLSIRKRSKTAL